MTAPLARDVINAVETAVVGKREAVTTALAVIFSNGHLLIEDIPGVGKTTLAKALARSLGCQFKRIQFTPDLLPSDVTGTSIFNQKSGEFEFRAGPVFANVVLADEINRTTPKTQAALLECMEERQVTIDGHTRPLPDPFFVIATQNNIEMGGTYPLPEAQLDRFAARIAIGYPERQDEMRILEEQTAATPVECIEPVLDTQQVVEIQHAVRTVHVDPGLRGYILDIVGATRTHTGVALAVSPRGALSLMHAAQALAALQGRTFVTPDDVKRLAVPVLAHRLVLRPEYRVKGHTASGCVAEILARTAVPVLA